MRLFQECKTYNIKIYQCPTFLFSLMGILIIFTIIFSYIFGLKIIEDPLIVALFVLFLSVFLLILAFFISNSFQNLVEANRMKTEFISIASHQLQTPLSSLRWALELLLSENVRQDPKKQTEFLNILKEESDKMRELMRDLISVAKIESEQLFLTKEKISLKEIVQKTISELENKAKEKNLEIVFECQTSLPFIFTSKSAIQTAIWHLLDNAIKFSKNGGKIKISLWPENKKVFFKIEDQGIGIPESDQKFIFQKFFRAKNAFRYQTKGTGLGLFIVKNIIERSGGKIKFSSKEDKGTTFWFYLPALNHEKDTFY
ncbi:HAMP domain-containing histidine kinase [Candidatus Parcubacteria bacterium]|nr:HAMP domain-containing histidine kinase [Candidatus Parcubacteria bacterium]